jgi:hypothetical protein
MLVVFLVENHQNATHFLKTKYFVAKIIHLKVIKKSFFSGGYCHIYAYWL